jgi:putative transposase
MGWCRESGIWPYSSFHRMVKLGIYPEDRAGDVADHVRHFGERP